MNLLKSRYMNAKNEQERDAVRKEIAELCDEDTMKVASIATEQIQESIDEINGIIIRRQLEDILPFMSLAYIAKRYFGKSRQWLYQRVNGTIVNGKPARFTNQEIDILNAAIQDMGNRLLSTKVVA
ncbi:MAG: DUF5053 domain-containing protein [Bacteroidales bacterium]|nr:DUF5053 domain-containing protein [Bacteroidales bacterium]